MKLNDKVSRIPLTFADYDPKTRKTIIKPLRGKVVYIHPRRRFHIVEFETPGGPIRESFLGMDF